MDAWDELPEEKKGKGPPKVAKVSVFDLLNNNLQIRSEEHTSELQSPVPISYAVFCLKKKK